jgi:transcriptional regulator with XRE-family HTH domain
MVENGTPSRIVARAEGPCKKPGPRFFAEVNLNETIQRGSSGQQEERNLVITIRLCEGISFDEAKDRVLAGIERVFGECPDASKQKSVPETSSRVLKEDFPRILKTLREGVMLTQAELANKLEVSPSSVAKWEGGSVAPRIKMIAKIALVFGIPVDEFYAPDDSFLKGRELKKEFASMLKDMRTKAGFSQDELAQRVGLFSGTSVCQWELGRGRPTDKIVWKIARIFGIPAEEFYAPEGRDNPKGPEMP